MSAATLNLFYSDLHLFVSIINSNVMYPIMLCMYIYYSCFLYIFMCLCNEWYDWWHDGCLWWPHICYAIHQHGFLHAYILLMISQFCQIISWCLITYSVADTIYSNLCDVYSLYNMKMECATELMELYSVGNVILELELYSGGKVILRTKARTKIIPW